MGPNNTKNSSKSVIFSYLTMNNIVRILLLLQKNTKFDQKTVSSLCVKTKSVTHKQPISLWVKPSTHVTKSMVRIQLKDKIEKNMT